MKNKMFLLIVVLVIVLTVSVSAINTRAAFVQPYLAFSGTTAICEVLIYGDTESDTIEAEIELWQGGVTMDTWSVSGTEYVEFSETVNAIQGCAYTLRVYATINGRELPMEFAARICP